MSSSIFSRRFVVRYLAVSACLAVVALGVAAAVLKSGLVSFAADRPTSQTFYGMVHGAFKASVARRGADIEVPETVDLDDPGLVSLGAQHYSQTCARCHGAPGLSQNPQVLAMDPAPQYLPAVVDQFDDGALYWIVRHGVMMSAMPAWPTESRADEPWALVAFLRRLPGLSPSGYAEATRPDPTDGRPVPFGPADPVPATDHAGALPYPAEEHAAAPPSSNFADYAALSLPIAQCAGCHGADGTGAPTGGQAPNLAILSEDTIVRSLDAYARGARASGFMQVVAAQLSEQQIDDLAAYYSGLPDRPAPASAPSQSLVRAGETIAARGLPGEGVAPCLACHAGGVPEGGPASALAGQSQPYLALQLALFRDGARQGADAATWSPMGWVAHALSDEEIDAVSVYFAALEPGARPEPEPASTAGAKEIVSRVCKECHGETLTGVPSGEYPNLTLQRGPYVLSQFGAFHQTLRGSERMKLVTNALSADDRATMAAYIDSLPPEPRQGEPVEGDPALGRRIAMEGLPDQDVPACLSCHGPDGLEGLPMTPRLHGQYPKYLVHRLDRLSAGDALTDSPMPRIASALTDEDREAVAAWFAAEQPVPK